MDKEEALRELIKNRDESYKAFNDVIANCPDIPTLGVRVPKVRAVAARAGREDPDTYFASVEVCREPMYLEEHMLWGMAIGYTKNRPAAWYQERLDRYVPGIASWGDCDCGTSTLKFMERDQELWFAYLEKWLKSSREFELRFGIVALMDYYLKDEWIDQALDYFCRPLSEAYYVRMAQAWALSVAFVKYREKTLERFQTGIKDAWVQNKAIQKCRESRRVSPQDKELLLGWKRR
ncbi:MAG TPA: DNA alkylation repair protein [Candidatus Choladousia intestinavium]|uniref:DNA alkylation repair protein n=1 Tax=Candidatus Choladousia intestinavium TaxID=2840727 RepID=A0A9D1ADJ9_9FIRM|nr:DNA alkylation repair protein [Candidatus Choladousia intestinavium]